MATATSECHIGKREGGKASKHHTHPCLSLIGASCSALPSTRPLSSPPLRCVATPASHASLPSRRFAWKGTENDPTQHRKRSTATRLPCEGERKTEAINKGRRKKRRKLQRLSGRACRCSHAHARWSAERRLRKKRGSEERMRWGR